MLSFNLPCSINPLIIELALCGRTESKYLCGMKDNGCCGSGGKIKFVDMV